MALTQRRSEKERNQSEYNVIHCVKGAYPVFFNCVVVVVMMSRLSGPRDSCCGCGHSCMLSLLGIFSQHCLFSVAVFLALWMDFMAEARGGSLICGTGEDHGSPRLSSTTGLRGLSAQLENRQVPSGPCTTCGRRVVDPLPSQCHGGGWGWGG